MSNINDENQSENEQQGVDKATGRPFGYVPPTLAERLAVQPRLASGASFESRMLTALDQIRYLSDRIRINTESTAKYLDRHMTDLNRSQGMAQDVKQQAERFSSNTIQGQLLRKQDLMLPSMRERYEQLAGGQVTDPMGLLRSANLLSRTGEMDLGTNVLTSNKVRELAEQFKAGNIEQAGEIGKQFAAQVSRAQEHTLVQQVADTASERERAKAQGAYNIATSQGLLTQIKQLVPRMMGTFHGVPHDIPTVPNIPGTEEDDPLLAGAILRQPGGFASRLRTGLAGRAATGGRLGSLAGMFGAGGMLGKAIPVVGEAIMGYELLTRFGRDLPLVGSSINLARQNFGPQALLSGQLTGEGTMAGFRAQQAVTGLTPGGRVAPTLFGMNLANAPVIGGLFRAAGGLRHPFDPITNQIAQEIVTSVRTQGFTGPMANQLYKQVASVYRDLGLSVEQTTQMITEAMRGGGESLNQIVTEMKGFDDAAHNLSMNINTYAASVNTIASQYRAQGAGPGATQLAQSFLNAMPRNMREGAGLQEAQTLFQNFRPLIAAQMGVPQQLLMDPRYQGRTQAAFGASVMGYLSAMPGRDLREKAEYATLTPGTLLTGMSVQDVLNLVNRAQSSRGTQAQGVFRQAARDYRRELSHATGFSDVEVQHLTPAQLRQFGITRQRSSLSGQYSYLRGGFTISPLSRYRVATVGAGAEALSDEKLRSLREAAIERVGVGRGGLLTQDQARKLRHDILNRTQGHWIDEFNQMAQKAGTKRNQFTTPFGTIQVTAAPGLRKMLGFQVNQRQFQYGQIPSNRAFPFADQRNSPIGQQ